MYGDGTEIIQVPGGDSVGTFRGTPQNPLDRA